MKPLLEALNFTVWTCFCLAMLVQLDCIRGQATGAPSAPPARLTVQDIMQEPSIAGLRPIGAQLSPDSHWVAYLWNASGREPRDLYVVPASGGAPLLAARSQDGLGESAPKPRTAGEARSDSQRSASAATVGGISALEWSPDSKQILYLDQNDIFLVTPGDQSVQRLTATTQNESYVHWCMDAHRFLYISDGQLYIWELDHGAVAQLTNVDTAAWSISNPVLSDDSAYVAYVASDITKQRELIVPNYVDEFVTGPSVRRGWTEQRVEIVSTSGKRTTPVAAALPGPEGAGYVRGIRWLRDASAFIVDRIDKDTRRRQLLRVNPRAGTSILLHQEIDEKWIAPLSRIVEPTPDGAKLLFSSEVSGFNHLYLLPLDGKPGAEPIQLTKGEWEIDWAKWLANGVDVIYASTQGSTRERHFYLINSLSKTIVALPDDKGMNISPQLSNDGETLLFEHSRWNEPGELFVMRVCPGCRGVNLPRRITETVPAQFKQIGWTEPRFFQYPVARALTPDGKQDSAGSTAMVQGRVYLPQAFAETNIHYPAVIFVHGAGYLQNVIDGWNNYYREFMFNCLLVQRGYVVLDVDYRGSAGYGRDWRTDVYGFLGGLDLADQLAVIDYAVKAYRVDADRVGIYGGSYGGFMAEMAVMRAPDKIACAAALRPVADWKNYFASSPTYTTERLGFPDKNAEWYRRSSPITYADKLAHPLLILHGLLDDNVHAQDSMQLVEKLIHAHKTSYFEVMFYPAENHTFSSPDAWTDEYERILGFMDQHLRPNATSAGSMLKQDDLR